MAIDTRNKRSSAINVASPWRGLLPLPDGALDQADRQHTAHMYSGILAGGGAPAPPVTLRLVRGPLPKRRRRRKKRHDEEELLLLI